MIALAAVVAQQKRPLVVIGDKSIQIAVVVVVGKGRTPADSAQGRSLHQCKPSGPVVGKELVRLRIGRGLVERLDFWMYVAIGQIEI